jgi:hypothetical protein
METNMQKLTPRWKIPTKPARDASGVDRGGRGYGEAENPFESDRAEYIGSYDRDADAMIYGNQAVGRREGDVVNPAQPKSARRDA